MFFVVSFLINLIIRCVLDLKVLKKWRKMLDHFENLTVWKRVCSAFKSFIHC